MSALTLVVRDSRHPAGFSVVTVMLMVAAVISGCASLPPGSDFPKAVSSALVHPEETRLGRHFESAARQNAGYSGFRLIPAGADGFLVRMQMIEAAEKTLDLQYFIFRGDNTGGLLTNAVLHAADRGVRVRVLLDDGETAAGDEQLIALQAHPSVQIRIFNPFRYRGHSTLRRGLEFAFDESRLDYRMHNKLLVVDNAAALIGGRNIGDEYFQVDPGSQFGDDDVFAAGPIASRLSATFDEYWNSAMAIPVQALAGGQPSRAALSQLRAALDRRADRLKAGGADYVQRVATGEPFASMFSGRLPLIWAHAELVSDSPDKRQVESGAERGRLMEPLVAHAAAAAQSELLVIMPYLVPGDEGMKLLKNLRQRDVRVRILTTSLESSTALLAQSGYMQYRVPLLESGVELYEVRALLGSASGSGQTAAMSRHGNYSLHGKMIVFDRQRLFIGSMNMDQRSKSLNTEIGLIIDSPVLAQQVAERFDAMVQPLNSYELVLYPNDSGAPPVLPLRPNDPDGPPSLAWRTREGDTALEHDTEPARSGWQRLIVNFLALLPLGREL